MIQESERRNFIGGVMGKKGSGKSFLVKQAVEKMRRLIIVDPMYEYVGTICDDWETVVQVIDRHREINFKVVYRPHNDADLEKFMAIINTVNDYTLVFEEVDRMCDPRQIHPELLHLTKYGRHSRRNLLWISRNPYEISRFLTRNSDFLLTFRQTEPRDLEYLNEYTFKNPIESLEKYDWTYHADDEKDEQMITTIFGKKPEGR
jgi:hypothetical protein